MTMTQSTRPDRLHLVSRNGGKVHASARRGEVGITGQTALCTPTGTMAYRGNAGWAEDVTYDFTQAPVTCKRCLTKLAKAETEAHAEESERAANAELADLEATMRSEDPQYVRRQRRADALLRCQAPASIRPAELSGQVTAELIAGDHAEALAEEATRAAAVTLGEWIFTAKLEKLAATVGMHAADTGSDLVRALTGETSDVVSHALVKAASEWPWQSVRQSRSSIIVKALLSVIELIADHAAALDINDRKQDNPPVFTAEQAAHIARAARRSGIGTGFVATGDGKPARVSFIQFPTVEAWMLSTDPQYVRRQRAARVTDGTAALVESDHAEALEDQEKRDGMVTGTMAEFFTAFGRPDLAAQVVQNLVSTALWETGEDRNGIIVHAPAVPGETEHYLCGLPGVDGGHTMVSLPVTCPTCLAAPSCPTCSGPSDHSDGERVLTVDEYREARKADIADGYFD